jgi:hypothetical protein
MSDYVEKCSLCEQFHSAIIELNKLKKLVRAAYSEGFTDGMGNMCDSEAWENSQTRMCLENGFDVADENE